MSYTRGSQVVDGYSDDEEEDDVVTPTPTRPLNHIERAKQLKKNSGYELWAAMADGTILGTIFSMFLTQATHIFLNVLGKFILFPMAAGANIALSITAWNQARLDGFKRGSVVKAVMQTLFTIPITIAVAGSLLLPATSLFPTVIAPITFSATLGVKFLFQVATAAFYWGKSTGRHWDKTEQNEFQDGETDEEKRAKYRGNAKANGVFAVSTLFATGAILTVFLFTKIAFAPLGIIAGVLGAGYVGLFMKHDPARDIESEEEDRPFDPNNGEEHDETHDNDLRSTHDITHSLQTRRGEEDFTNGNNGSEAEEDAIDPDLLQTITGGTVQNPHHRHKHHHPDKRTPQLSPTPTPPANSDESSMLPRFPVTGKGASGNPSSFSYSLPSSSSPSSPSHLKNGAAAAVGRPAEKQKQQQQQPQPPASTTQTRSTRR